MDQLLTLGHMDVVMFLDFYPHVKVIFHELAPCFCVCSHPMQVAHERPSLDRNR